MIPALEERGGFRGPDFIRNGSQAACFSDHHFRISSIHSYSRYHGVLTVHNVSAPARFARPVFAAEETDTNALPDLPSRNVGTELLDTEVMQYKKPNKVDLQLSFCKLSGVRLCTLSGVLCQYGSIGETHGTDPKRLALDRFHPLPRPSVSYVICGADYCRRLDPTCQDVSSNGGIRTSTCPRLRAGGHASTSRLCAMPKL